jgi:hypothetical protein
MVQVINASGNFSQGQESFPILIGNGGGTNVLTTNNVISNCEVSSVKGNYTTAITLQGQGIIRFCNVIFTDPTTGSGYQANATSNSLIISNSCVGGANGFYKDTHSDNNLAIEYNTFQCRKGIYFDEGSGWTVNGLTLLGNHIGLLSNSTNPGEVNGIELACTATNIRFSHVTIAGNIIKGANSGILIRLFDSAFVTNVNNILWTTNVGFSPYYMIYMQDCSNTLTANNLIYGNGQSVSGIFIVNPSTAHDAVLNNIVMGCNLNSIYVANTACISVCDSNLFYPFTSSAQTLAQWQSAGFDNHSVFANPLVANTNTGSFQLTSNSPAIAHALNLTANGIINDASGNSRPARGNWDIGAYEFDAPSPVSPPSHLQIRGSP